MSRPLAFIVVAQLLGTSLWFTGNSAAAALAVEWGLTTTDLGRITIAVQAGFIAGTLLLVLSGLADRFPASRIFTLACIFGAAANAGFALLAQDVQSAIFFRFATGVALAGIYPMGMKLVVSWTPEKTGEALGWLVGTLTFGTSVPHLVRAIGASWEWETVVLTSSGLALAGGVLISRLGDGPHLPWRSPVRLGAAFRLFGLADFRAAALSYFGHMWELYAFWTIAPLLAAQVVLKDGGIASGGERAIPFLSFAVIAAGGFGCILGGRMSRRFGSARVAGAALAVSGLLCFVYPFASAAGTVPAGPMLALLLLWGVSVVTDSPQFSALVAQAVPRELVGSALTLQNCIGFLITLLSIDLATAQWMALGPRVTWMLGSGPILGLLFLLPLMRGKATDTRRLDE
jgi:MFS family permease